MENSSQLRLLRWSSTIVFKSDIIRKSSTEGQVNTCNFKTKNQLLIRLCLFVCGCLSELHCMKNVCVCVCAEQLTARSYLWRALQVVNTLAQKMPPFHNNMSSGKVCCAEYSSCKTMTSRCGLQIKSETHSADGYIVGFLSLVGKKENVKSALRVVLDECYYRYQNRLFSVQWPF